MDDYGIGAAVGGLFNIGTTALQNKYNKEQAALQNQYNIDMWNRQNEYNSPASQMNRLKEAGLNPNLMYGQGSSGNASSAPAQVAPQKQAPEMAAFGQAVDAISLLSSLEGLKKQRIENNTLANEERQSFFHANMLEEYYRARTMGSQALLQDLYGPNQFDEVSSTRRATRGERLYFRRPYAPLSMDRPWFLAQKEQQNAYNVMQKNFEDLGYQVDLSNYRQQMMAKDLQWYTGNQIFDMVTGGIGALSSLLGSVGRLFGRRRTPSGNFHRPIVNNQYYNYYR